MHQEVALVCSLSVLGLTIVARRRDARPGASGQFVARTALLRVLAAIGAGKSIGATAQGIVNEGMNLAGGDVMLGLLLAVIQALGIMGKVAASTGAIAEDGVGPHLQAVAKKADYVVMGAAGLGALVALRGLFMNRRAKAAISI